MAQNVVNLLLNLAHINDLGRLGRSDVALGWPIPYYHLDPLEPQVFPNSRIRPPPVVMIIKPTCWDYLHLKLPESLEDEVTGSDQGLT